MFVAVIMIIFFPIILLELHRLTQMYFLPVLILLYVLSCLCTLPVQKHNTYGHEIASIIINPLFAGLKGGYCFIEDLPLNVIITSLILTYFCRLYVHWNYSDYIFSRLVCYNQIYQEEQLLNCQQHSNIIESWI